MKITQEMLDEAFELAKAAIAQSNLASFLGSGKGAGMSTSENKGLITHHFSCESETFFGGMSIHVTIKVNEDGTMEADDNITFAGQTRRGEGPLGPAQFFWGIHGWKAPATQSAFRSELQSA